MKKWWEKVKEFFSRPKVIRWTIVILTLAIIGGSIKALIWTIYTKDKPAFVPQEVREDIQGVIKESGEAIKTVSKPIGSAIVDSAYQKPAPVVADPPADWITYTDPILGISLKYPEGMVVESFEDPFEEYVGTVTFSENSVAVFDIDIFNSNEPSFSWVNGLANETGLLTDIVEIKLGARTFVKAIEGGDPDHYIYVLNNNDRIYKYKTPFETAEVLENVLQNNN